MNLLLSIPDGFVVFGHTIKFYGIISALSYLLGVLLACHLSKKRGLKSDDILVLACYVIPLAIIGARVYYILFRLEYYTNFWDVFKIWEGGLAFYGGMIGGALGVIIYCLIHKKNFLALIDIIAPSMILAQALGRWGNFFNQEAYGYYIENPNFQWFPFGVYIDNCTKIGEGCLCGGSGWHLATFFYESLWNLLSFAVLYTMIRRVNFKQNGMIAASYLILYGTGRVFIEGLRLDSLYLGTIRISQLLSGVFILVGIVAYIIYFVKKRKKEDSFDKIMKILKED